MGRVLAIGVILLVSAVGCHTITEELPPAQNVSGPNPVIVNPPPGNSVLIITPPSTQAPAPPPPSQAQPTPTPPSSNPSQPNNAPATEVFVSVTSFLRN